MIIFDNGEHKDGLLFIDDWSQKFKVQGDLPETLSFIGYTSAIDVNG